jgi:hypothetical protein
MAAIRRRLDEQVKAGRLREQCANCKCSKVHHTQERDFQRCNVCWEPCNYEPAWVVTRQPGLPLDETIG